MLDLTQLDLGDLAEALEDHSYDHSWWLDPKTGEVVLWNDYFEEQGTPMLLALNSFDHAARFDLGEVREALGVGYEVPIVECDGATPNNARFGSSEAFCPPRWLAAAVSRMSKLSSGENWRGFRE